MRLHAGHERHVVTEIRLVTVDSSHVGGEGGNLKISGVESRRRRKFENFHADARVDAVVQMPLIEQISAVLVIFSAKTLQSS